MIQANSDNRSTTLILVRHGQTDWNEEDRIQGQVQVDLCEEGRRQAALTAQRLSRVPTTALYSSDLKRALESAEPIARELGLMVQLAPELRERSFGQWEGKTWPELTAADPTLRALHRGDPRFVPPGGESRDQVWVRVTRFAQGIAQEHVGQTVIVVTHGGPINVLVRWVIGSPNLPKPGFAPRNASLTTLRHDDGQWQLVCFNDTCHLTPRSEAQAKTDADFTEESNR